MSLLIRKIMTWVNGTFIIAKLIIMKSESRYQLISLLSINKIFSFKILVLIVMAFCSALNAAEPMDDVHGFTPVKSTHAHWIFSGIVVNENGENYNYFFKMQRAGNEFHATVALFDSQTKKIILKDDSHASIDEADINNLLVGRAFLRFNAMNDSWIFGLKDTHNKNGFNFKVDMLNRPDQEPVTKYFRHGISFIVVQTGQLNGLIKLEGEDKEQFVTAHNAWFRQIWLNNTIKAHNFQEKPDQLNGLLCRFNDGSGLYSMKVLESDSLRGAVVGLFDAEGAPSAISQFIHIEPTQDNTWSIRIPSPKMHLVLTDIIQHNEMLTGFISDKDKEGFCVLSQDDLSFQVTS